MAFKLILQIHSQTNTKTFLISNNASLKEKLSFTKTQSTQAVHYGYQDKRLKCIKITKTYGI